MLYVIPPIFPSAPQNKNPLAQQMILLSYICTGKGDMRMQHQAATQDFL